jgi:hypothetical protein
VSASGNELGRVWLEHALVLYGDLTLRNNGWRPRLDWFGARIFEK